MKIKTVYEKIAKKYKVIMTENYIMRCCTVVFNSNILESFNQGGYNGRNMKNTQGKHEIHVKFKARVILEMTD